MKKKCRRNKIIEHEQISKVLCNKQIELFQKKKKNPLTEMSLNLEVNPLTPKNKKKIKKLLFQTNLKLYKIFVNIISFVHITINLHINSKNRWLSYAKIQEILRALSTFTWVFSFCRIHYGIIVGPLDERLWGDQLRCMCYYKIVKL